MNIKRILTIVFVLIPFAVSAQNLRAVRGSVFDANGEPLPAAKVVHGGNLKGEEVKPDGSFIIQIPYNMKEVTATCEGYLPMTLEVDGSYMAFRLKLNKKAPSKSKKAAPAQTAPVQTKPVETKPVETKPVQTSPVQSKPVETKPVQTKPVETKPVQTAPVQTKPEVKEEVKTEPKRVAKPAPVETRPIETKPVETKPVESKTAVKEDQKQTVPAKAKPAKKAKSASQGLINSVELSYGMQFGGTKSVILKQIGHYQYTSVNPVEFNYLIGYRFNDWLALSLGTGVSYDTINLNGSDYEISGVYSKLIDYSPLRIPVFINMKTFMSDNKVQPMASLSVGAMSGSLKNFSQDWNMTAELGLGLGFKMGKKGSFYLLASGELSPMPVFETGRASSSRVKGTYRSGNTLAGSVKMGFMF